jgi:3-dehydroquinate dehydratase-2
MTRILVFQGANLNWLGIRQPEYYGTASAAELDARIRAHAEQRGYQVEIFYTNSEGEGIDRLYRAHDEGMDAVVMNPGGFTYGGHALQDAIKGIRVPVVEVHITNQHQRGIHSAIGDATVGTIFGFGLHGYILGLEAALEIVAQRRSG